MHERRNGQFLLQSQAIRRTECLGDRTGWFPSFLQRWLFDSRNRPPSGAAEMLDVFGMRQGGSQYRRLIAAFQRVFGATIFFGTDIQRERAAVMHQSSIQFHARGAHLVFA